MYHSKSKYSAQQDAIIEGCAMVKLAEATDALTLDEIIRGEPLLTGVTTQKLARVMMKFVDMGFVVKQLLKTIRFNPFLLVVMEHGVKT